MELRVLRYFIEVAREGSITGAARMLHISQPTLSKQLKELESELGCKLFVRGSYNVSLTEEGILLRKRAEDILDMANKTVGEFQSLNDVTGGDVRIGCAESWLICHLAATIKDFRLQYPGLRFHITSGDTRVVVNRAECRFRSNNCSNSSRSAAPLTVSRHPSSDTMTHLIFAP